MNNKSNSMFVPPPVLNTNSDAEDDAFCAFLYEEYLADVERGQTVTLEEAAAALGIEL